MGTYVPATAAERKEMLAAIGMKDERELYADVPKDMFLDHPLNIPAGMSELEVRSAMEKLAAENKQYRTVLRGAGAYDHYIPSIVKYVPAKEEFLTAYTPYQAEMSQGILQSIFEYQTMICQLTGMDVSNASVYDGATAAAEAASMCRDRKRSVTLISGAAHPDTINTVRTYCYGANAELRVIPCKDGVTDLEALKEMLTPEVASVIIQQPNFFMSCDPISLAILPTPKEMGADVMVGEGQCLGLPLGWGGPYLGIMACTAKHMRKLPGRIVGETTDHDGNKAYVLSLQAREQHIRREKASSNICSNEALCALTAGLYLAAMGPEGLREAAKQTVSKAHYLQAELCKLPGVSLKYDAPFYQEFVTVLPKRCEVLKALDDAGILGGLPLGEDEILWCATEKLTKAQLDEAVAVVKEVLAK